MAEQKWIPQNGRSCIHTDCMGHKAEVCVRIVDGKFVWLSRGSNSRGFIANVTELSPLPPAPAEEKWTPKLKEKCLCTDPPSDLFKDDQIEVVPRCIGKHWSWVGLLDHAGVDDLTNGLIVPTDSLRQLPSASAPAEEKWEPRIGDKCLFGNLEAKVLARDGFAVWIDALGGYQTVSTSELRPLPPEPPVEKEPERIFSGPNSVAMWDQINHAKSVHDLERALYGVCCKLQELEEKVVSESK